MPMMVNIVANPAFKPTAEQRAVFAEIKTKGAVEVSYQVALDNVLLSGGMYKIEEAAPPPSTVRNLEDMDTQELKLMMLQLGVATEKQMKRDEVIKMIRIKLDQVEITDE